MRITVSFRSDRPTANAIMESDRLRKLAETCHSGSAQRGYRDRADRLEMWGNGY